MTVGAGASRRRTQGAGLRFLSGPITSPSLAELMASARGLSAGPWHQCDPVSRDGARGARQAATGAAGETHLPLRQGRRHRVARRRLPGLRARRALRARLRRPPARLATSRQTMNRLYAIESTPSLTGAKADHRLPLRATDIEGFARAVAAAVGAGAGRTRAAQTPPGSRRSPRICRRTAAGRSSSPASTSPRRCTRSRTR